MNVEAEIIPPSSILATIDVDKAEDYFMKVESFTPILEKVRGAIIEFNHEFHDLSTEEGRASIASFAFKLAKTRTYIEGIGKKVAEDAKAKPKVIDATRRHVWDTIEKWQKDVRAPLTAWEEAEKDRKQTHIDEIRKIVELGVQEGKGRAAIYLKDCLGDLTTYQIPANAAEFEEEYKIAIAQAISQLQALLPHAEKAEAEAAELAALRAEKAARDAKEAAEAAERRRLAEIEREAQAQVERERARAAEETERREREHQAQLAEAERARQDTELRHREEIEAAERKAVEAEEKARRGTAEALERRQAEDSARESNRSHRAKINRDAVAAFSSHLTINADLAKKIVEAIARGEIPNVRIVY